jgi:hypothetical protein
MRFLPSRPCLFTGIAILAVGAGCSSALPIDDATEASPTETTSALTGVAGGSSALLPSWRRWESLSGVVTSEPSITASGSRLDVFATAYGSVYHRSFDGSAWSPGNGYWEALGNAGHGLGAPVAVSIGSRLEVFAVDFTTSHVVHRGFDGASWSAWEDIGGSAAGDKPAVVVEHVFKSSGGSAFTADVINVLVRNTDSTLALRTGTATGAWSAWRNLGGGIVGTPAAVSWGTNRVDVFVRGTDNRLYHNFADSWRDWAPNGYEALGGSIYANPAVTSWGAGRLDIFGTASDGAINHLAWTGSLWTPWEKVNVGYARSDVWGYAPPVAVAHGVGAIDVFVEGGDKSLWSSQLTSYGATSSTWSAWSPLADCMAPIGIPAAVSSDGVRYDLVMTGADHAVWHGIYDASLGIHTTGNLRPPACTDRTDVRWAVVLCQYADVPTIPKQEAPGKTNLPADRAFFERLYTSAGDGTGGMDDFIQSTTYGKYGFTGTVVDWHPISKRYADVGTLKRPNNGIMDCIYESQNLIDYRDHDNILVVMNKPTDNSDITMGGFTMTLNGATRAWGIDSTVPGGGYSISYNGQEMMHAWLAMPHAHDATGASDYGDPFDTMSCFNCKPANDDPNYSGTGPNINAGTRLWRGWTPPRRVATYAGATLTTDLAAIDHPEVDAPLVLKVPLPNGQFYTVELRRTTDGKGIDRGLLAAREIDPVLIHKVSADGQTYLQTAGAHGPVGGFSIGDTFVDTANNVSIKVVSGDANNNRARVTIAPLH